MLSNGTSSQPAYGQRLLPNLVDELSRSDPNHVYSLIPRSPDFSGGLQTVTISDFARAINRVAFWLEQVLGRASNFETIAYIGPCQFSAIDQLVCPADSL